MRKILLSNGLFCSVDDSDFEDLNQFHWHAARRKYTHYAHRMIDINGKRTSILMHRLISMAPKGMEVDHIDGDGLNNQKSNLRLATISQNRSHQIRQHPKKTSRFRGVSWSKSMKKWVSNIQVNKKYNHLGSFDSEIDAAMSYDRAAAENFKEFASTNFPV